VKRHLIACLLICAFGAAPIEHETPKLQIFLEGGNGLMTTTRSRTRGIAGIAPSGNVGKEEVSD
jgi:hypothetical protein